MKYKTDLSLLYNFDDFTRKVVQLMKQANFVIDSIEDQVFSGFTNGETWNGWECPFFEKQEAERVLRASEANGFTWEYDAEGDAYIVTNSHDEDYEPEVFEGTSHNLNGIVITLYGIGAYSWIWETTE